MAQSIVKRVKGTRDFYPEDWAGQKWLEEHFLAVGREFGYREYEGSILEYAELYLGKSSTEIVNEQTFQIQVKDGHPIVLRPELTPTLARMVAAEEGRMAFPVRWQSYGQFFRYERPQRGRGREFFQWNIDLLGADSPAADAEMITVACTLFKRLGLKPEHVAIRVNDREALDAFLAQDLSVAPDLVAGTFALIDRMDKLGVAKFEAALAELGLDAGQIDRLEQALEKPDLAVSDWLRRVLDLVEANGVSEYVETDLRIVRGFDYYTRTVFEAWAKTSLRRALFGGGRYDNLTLQVGGKKQIQGVGLAVGDMALAELLREVDLYPTQDANNTRAYVSVFSEDLLPVSTKLAQELRARGVSAELHLKPGQRLDRQFKHADRLGIRFVLVVGPEEAKTGRVTLKDLTTGEQTSGTAERIAESINNCTSTT